MKKSLCVIGSFIAILFFGSALAIADQLDEIATKGAYHRFGDTGDSPPLRLLIAQPRVLELSISLPQLSTREEAQIDDPEFDVGNRVGIHRALPERLTGDLAPKLEWRKSSDGVVAYMRIQSPMAQSVRFLTRLKLPAGGSLAFYESTLRKTVRTIEKVSSGSKGLNDDEYWSPDALGDTIGVEIRLQKVRDIRDFEIQIVRVAHRYARFGDPGNHSTELACAGHQEVQCAIDNGDIDESHTASTLLLVYEKDDASYVCGGVLMNVTDGEDVFKPYVLTAAHCISTRDVADTVVTHWFYKATSCGSVETDPNYRRISGGAAVLATLDAVDMTLLQLNNNAPSGVWYSGWLTADVGAGESAHGVHHPAGEHMKYFSGTTQSKRTISVCTDGEDCKTLFNAIRLRVDKGASEGGSSGSGLRLKRTSDEGERIVGILSASDETCVDGTTYFGEFRQFYPHIEDWFAPATDITSEVDDDHGNTTDTATLIPLGATSMGKIDSADDLDYFRVEVIEPGELEVFTSGSLDTVGRLLDKDGIEIAANDDEGSFSYNFNITKEVEAGTYFVEVDGYRSLTGEYNLHVNFTVPDDHGNSWSSATTISSSSRSWEYSTPGHIEEPEDIDVFEITLTRESKITMFTVGGTDTKGVLMDSSENELKSNEDSSDKNLNFRISDTLKSGTYHLHVTGNTDGRSSYELKVEVDAK